MMDEKLAKQIEQHKKRWKEHPEECPAEINSMSDEEVYEGIRNCTFLDTEIPDESREEFVRRLKKEKSKKINKKISGYSQPLTPLAVRFTNMSLNRACYVGL